MQNLWHVQCNYYFTRHQNHIVGCQVVIKTSNGFERLVSCISEADVNGNISQSLLSCWIFLSNCYGRQGMLIMVNKQ